MRVSFLGRGLCALTVAATLTGSGLRAEDGPELPSRSEFQPFDPSMLDSPPIDESELDISDPNEERSTSPYYRSRGATPRMLPISPAMPAANNYRPNPSVPAAKPEERNPSLRERLTRSRKVSEADEAIPRRKPIVIDSDPGKRAKPFEGLLGRDSASQGTGGSPSFERSGMGMSSSVGEPSREGKLFKRKFLRSTKREEKPSLNEIEPNLRSMPEPAVPAEREGLLPSSRRPKTSQGRGV